jgi:hypothetical protein
VTKALVEVDMRARTVFLFLLAAPLLAGPVRAGDEFPLDGFLTDPVRKAFAVAARNPEVWTVALGDPAGYLASRGIEVPRDLGVTFLDSLRGGDWIGFKRPGEVLEMYCPPERAWWGECRKIIRVCDTVDTCIPDGSGGCTVVKVEKNCAFVCEESIWDPTFSIGNRPPFPPLP